MSGEYWWNADIKCDMIVKLRVDDIDIDIDICVCMRKCGK